MVTYHVTAMVVQVEAARYLTAVPDRLDASLGAVSDTGRRAITDLRYMLDVLNPDHDTGGGTPSAASAMARRGSPWRSPPTVADRELGWRLVVRAHLSAESRP